MYAVQVGDHDHPVFGLKIPLDIENQVLIYCDDLALLIFRTGAVRLSIPATEQIGVIPSILPQISGRSFQGIGAAFIQTVNSFRDLTLSISVSIIGHAAAKVDLDPLEQIYTADRIIGSCTTHAPVIKCLPFLTGCGAFASQVLEVCIPTTVEIDSVRTISQVRTLQRSPIGLITGILINVQIIAVTIDRTVAGATEGPLAIIVICER